MTVTKHTSVARFYEIDHNSIKWRQAGILADVISEG